MSDSITWAFQLEDRMAASAGRIADALDRMEKVLDRVEGRTKKLDKALDGGEKGLKDTSKALKDHDKAAKSAEKSTGLFAGAWQGAHHVLGAVGHALEIANKGLAAMQGIANAGKAAVGIMAGRESLETQLELLLGSRDAARGLAKEAERVGSALGKGTSDVLTQFTALAGAGIDPINVPVVYQALSDISARGGNADSVLSEISDINALGRFEKSSLEKIVKNAGLALDDVYAKLEKQLGVSRERLIEALGAGKIDPSVGIAAVMETLSDTVGGRLGMSTQRQARTMSAQLSLLGKSWDNLIGAVDRDSGGFAVLRDLLSQVNRLLDPTTESGQRIVAIFERLDAAVERRLARWTGPDGMERFVADFDSLLTRAERLANLIFRVADAFGEAHEKSVGEDKSLGASGFQVLGRGIGGGWKMTERLGAQSMGVGTLLGLGVGAIEQITGKDIPWLAEGGVVTGPTLAMIGEAGPEAVIPLPKLGQVAQAATSKPRAGVTVNVTQNIEAREGMDTQALAAQVAEETRRVLAAEFDTMALEFGVA